MTQNVWMQRTWSLFLEVQGRKPWEPLKRPKPGNHETSERALLPSSKAVIDNAKNKIAVIQFIIFNIWRWYWIFRIFILGTRNTCYLLFIGHNTLTVLWNQDASQLPIFIISSPLYSSRVSQLFRYLESGRLLNGVTFDHDIFSMVVYQNKLICKEWLLSYKILKVSSLLILF